MNTLLLMKFLFPMLALTLTLVFSPAPTTSDVEARERTRTTVEPPHTLRDQVRPERTRSVETLAELPTTVTTKKPVVTEAEPEQPAPVVTPTPEPEIVELEVEETAPPVPVVTSETEVEAKPTPPPSSSYLEAVAAEVHRLTNRERTKAGLATLKTDTDLAAIATLHSDDMIDHEYFDHTTPDGCDVSCRFAAAEYDAWAWGENIAWRRSSTLPSAEDLAAHFFENWMDSKSHRENILSPDFTHEGVGLAQTGNTVYITVNFAEPE